MHEDKCNQAYSGKPFASHRADRDYGSTVLSVLAGAHSVGGGVLGFFDTQEARALRLVCSEFREAVSVVPWADMRTRIWGNVGGWRRSFPRATKANISVSEIDLLFQRYNAIVDADFVHFEGLHTLDMSRCDQVGITDAAFVHLKGIHTLKMSWCRQAGITDAAFIHLKGIHTLYMSECCQAGITDAAFVHLKEIHSLDMSWCSQARITAAAFVHLKGIHTLIMFACSQTGITDAAFVHLEGIHTLDMSRCWQAGITDAAFVHFTGIHTLDIRSCDQPGITHALRNRLRAMVPNLTIEEVVLLWTSL